MVEPTMKISPENLKEIESCIITTEGMGARIRQILGEFHGGNHDVGWEVKAAVEALEHRFALGEIEGDRLDGVGGGAGPMDLVIADCVHTTEPWVVVMDDLDVRRVRNLVHDLPDLGP